MRLGTFPPAGLSFVIYFTTEATSGLVILLSLSLESRIPGSPHHTRFTWC